MDTTTLWSEAEPDRFSAGVRGGAGNLSTIERRARERGHQTWRRAETEKDDTIVTTLSETLMARDPETGEHSKRVAKLAEGFGSFLGLPRSEVHSLYLAGLLHDIGKVGIRDDVLFKPGSLTPEEQHRIMEHPRIAEKILSPLGFEKVVRYIAVHHENIDGSGYPEGLRGEEIPLAGRALAIVDTYDALRSRRPYKEPLRGAETRLTMTAMAGGKLDPDLLEAFWEFLSGLPATRHERAYRDRARWRSSSSRGPGYPHLGLMARKISLWSRAFFKRSIPRRGIRTAIPPSRPWSANTLLPSGSTCST